MSPPMTRHVISVTNVTQHETFTYSLPIIKGYISNYSQEVSPKTADIILRRLSDNYCTRVNGTQKRILNLYFFEQVKDTRFKMPRLLQLLFEKLAQGIKAMECWPVINGNFKCLADLNLGLNSYRLEYEDATLELQFNRRALDSSYHVLPVYIICSDNDGTFQGPDVDDCSAASARRRIGLGSRLIQSVTAEKLHENDLGRRTFQLARDLDPSLDCILFRSHLTSSKVYEMAPEDIWEHFGRELVSSQYGREDRKFLAFLACTRYIGDVREPATHDEIVSRVQGHVALGGGGLAIVGTGCLHTWPETLQDVVPRFNDDTKIDKSRFMDDSCYRGTLGSCFSTTLGAVCHELGHAFDLGHSRKGIMGRGFDNIRLVFTVGGQSRDTNRNVVTRSDAQHATVAFTRDLNVTVTVATSPQRFSIRGEHTPHRTGRITPPLRGSTTPARSLPTNKIPVDDLTFWDKSCAVMLRYHKWFTDPVVDNLSTTNSSIEFDNARRTIVSPSGIRVVELRGEDGLILASWAFLSTWVPKQFVVPSQDQALQNATTLVAEDTAGNIIKESVFSG